MGTLSQKLGGRKRRGKKEVRIFKVNTAKS